MIKIEPTTKEETKEFEESVWRSVDMEHYGKLTEWKTAEFAFKATDDGEIVGSIIGRFEAGVLLIGSMLVREDRRLHGIGKMLMDEAEKWGMQEGAHIIHLNTGEDWQARKFYEALGYRKVADLKNYHFHKNFVIYEKLI
ncbi:MAG TPA: GNAT family N-acetyltransferase [Patescibacteria group bacterium]|nr:GNAT family N-acetyltransferase [Patescibacteria group bacterium]